MPTPTRVASARALAGFLFLLLTMTSLGYAQAQERIIHYFNGKDGAEPLTGVVMDKNGNLYGACPLGGDHSGGTVYMLSPGANGQWTRKVLYNFMSNPKDADEPIGGVILDSEGNLYGTTANGGMYGYGTVYVLMPTAKGPWREKILYNFNGTDGGFPETSLVFDAKGNLYGTTTGAFGAGVAFELTPDAHGNWTEKILHIFGSGQDGFEPSSPLIFDQHGDLYGTTFFGGTGRCAGSGCGTVFELIRGTKGQWTEKVLHNFNGRDGEGADGRLLFDKAGNLYGTTVQRGAHCCGTVFELMPQPDGTWAVTILHNGSHRDGGGSQGGLTSDEQGNLYATGYQGTYGHGSVFELIRESETSWIEKLLYSFNPNTGTDGLYPVSVHLIFDKAGHLYGTTQVSGTDNRLGPGTVFEITP